MTEQFTFRNPVKQLGYSHAYHVVLDDDRLGHATYRLLMFYLRYAQKKDYCWPSIKTIATKMGTTTRTITRYNKELEELGYITRQRKMGTSTTTIIEDIENIPYLQELATREIERREAQAAERAAKKATDRTPVSCSTRHQCPVEEESLKKDDITEYESPSETLAPAGRTFFEKQGQEPKPSETEPVPEKKSERSRPRVVSHRQSTPHSTMFSALRVAFRFPSKMTPSQAGRLNKLAKLVLENEYTVAQVKEVGVQWWTSWPGNLGGSNIPKNDQFLERLEQLRVAQSKRRKV